MYVTNNAYYFASDRLDSEIWSCIRDYFVLPDKIMATGTVPVGTSETLMFTIEGQPDCVYTLTIAVVDKASTSATQSTELTSVTPYCHCTYILFHTLMTYFFNTISKAFSSYHSIVCVFFLLSVLQIKKMHFKCLSPVDN